MAAVLLSAASCSFLHVFMRVLSESTSAGDASLRRPPLLDPTSCYSYSRTNNTLAQKANPTLRWLSVLLLDGQALLVAADDHERPATVGARAL